MKPNLIYIFADQLRYQSMSYAGDSKAKTPFIDALCSQGINVCNAVSGHPVCAPYRASLFTGKYTPSTGMVINELRMNTKHTTFADVLNDNGYETSYIGKWHMYDAQCGNHYDTQNSFIPKGRDRLGFNGYFAAYNFHHDYYGETAYYHLDTPTKIYCKGYEPDIQTNMAIEQLSELNQTGKPFALFLSYGTPHDPWKPENVPPKYLEYFKDTVFTLPENYLPENDKYADICAKLGEKERKELTEWIRVYYAMVANLDDNIGRLVETIEKMGLDNNTIIIFTSDHGEMFGAHGRRAKNIFYEEAVRVPFIINWKDKIKENRICDVCLNTVDIMPTLLSMMSLPIPQEVEGTDLTGYILDEIQTPPVEGALMMGTGHTCRYEDGHEWRAFRTKDFTYATYLVDNTELLFCNTKDPLQLENLVGNINYESIKNQIKDQMYKQMYSIGDQFKKCSYYEQNWINNRKIECTVTLKNK